MVIVLAVDQSKQRRKLDEKRPSRAAVFDEKFPIVHCLNTGEVCNCERTGEGIDVTDLNGAAEKRSCEAMEDNADSLNIGSVDNSRQYILECIGKKTRAVSSL